MASSQMMYFGFGSLVNRLTRPSGELAINARLNGWQRVWEHRVVGGESGRSCTSLSVQPASGQAIDGVLVSLAPEQLPDLDKREAGYERLSLPATSFSASVKLNIDTVYVYRSLPTNRCVASHDYPILQSYIDCVAAGYDERFGRDGLKLMLQSTIGWENPILNDRAKPLYPRSVTLSSERLAQYDSCLQPYRNPDNFSSS